MLTGSVEAEAEKVASVEINSDVAIISGDDLTVGYTVKNQYGEDITSKAKSGLIASATNGTSTTDATIDLTTTTGVAVIDNGTSKLDAGDKLTLTIVDADTGVVASKELTVSAESAVAEIAFGELYNEDGLELSMDNSDKDFYLEIIAKDQYGNALEAGDLTPSTVVLTSSDSSVVTATVGDITSKDIDGDDKEEIVVKVTPISDGTAKLTLVSLYNGKSTTTTLEVAKATSVDSISLSAPDLAVAGEKVVIPFSALTNKGDEPTKVSLLNSVTVTASVGTGLAGTIPNPTFKKNVSTGEIELTLDLTSVTGKGKVTLVATTPTGKVATLTVDVKEAAKPVAITGLKNINLNQVVGNAVNISYKNLVLVDQYERTLTDSQVAEFLNGGYKVKLSVESTDVVAFDSPQDLIGEAEIDYDRTDETKATLRAIKKGTETVTFELYDETNNKVVTDSAYEISVKIAQQSEFESYEVADVEAIYNDGVAGAYMEDLEVYGVLANGTKVVLPTSAYNVVTNNANVTATAVDADNKYELDVKAPISFKDDETEKTVNVTVTINDTGETLTKAVTVSNVKPKVAEIKFTSAVVKGSYDLETKTGLTTADIAALLDESVDTYGEEVVFSIADADTVAGGYTGEVDDLIATYKTGDIIPVYITISELVDADGGDTTKLAVAKNGTPQAAVSGIGASEADSFRVTIKADNASASFVATK